MKDINEAVALINAHAPIRGFRVVSDEDLIDGSLLEEIVRSRRLKIGEKIENDSVIQTITDILIVQGLEHADAEDLSIRIVMELRNV